jgi:hypothetical protein
VKKILVSILLILSLSPLWANNDTLSTDARISILTCAPGEELYSVFGHSAIRVTDSIANVDWVFNYGTFDFDTPNFYLKFANGNLDYLLSVSRYKSFLQAYIFEERSIVEQQLNLTQQEKQLLFDRLKNNAMPENRAYRYNFFFDNCATRIRDRIFDCFPRNSIVVDTLGAQLTFRQLYGSYLKHSPWVEFGIHLLLGKGADKVANGLDEMYVPDYLYSQFKTTEIKQVDGSSRNLVQSESTIISYPRPSGQKPFLLWPQNVFVILLILILALTVFEIKRKKRIRSIDSFLLVITSLAGFLFIFLWFFTKHGVTQDNYNILWSSPLNLLLLAILPLGQRFQKIKKAIVSLILVCNIVFFIAWITGIQAFPAGLAAFVAVLSVREIGIAYQLLGYNCKGVMRQSK